MDDSIIAAWLVFAMTDSLFFAERCGLFFMPHLRKSELRRTHPLYVYTSFAMHLVVVCGGLNNTLGINLLCGALAALILAYSWGVSINMFCLLAFRNTEREDYLIFFALLFLSAFVFRIVFNKYLYKCITI
jgi:hypothetical protein